MTFDSLFILLKIRAKVSAEAIAEIINSFVEPISYKALVIMTVHVLDQATDI